MFVLGEQEKEMKRALGLVIMRGENIVSITAEAPPGLQVTMSLNSILTYFLMKARKEGTGGPGKAQPVNRAVTGGPNQTQIQQPGVGGAAKGMGVANPNSMMPSKSDMQPASGQLPGTNQAMPPTSMPPTTGQQ